MMAGTLPVTDRTGGHVFRVRNLVLLFQPEAELDLIWRRLVRHVEHLVARPQKFLRSAVTIEAPAHEEWLRLVHQRHLVHAAMTGRAAGALPDMDLVVEVDEVREVVHPNPRQIYI